MSRTATTRAMRPKPPIAVVPLAVTQATAPHVLGVEPRRFLELVARLEIPHTRAGKLVICLVSDVLDALAASSASRANAASASDAPANDASASALDDDQPETADEVLAALGFRRKAAAR